MRILTRLTDAVIFEEFIQKRFTGAKSFSLEGAESLIPLLDLAIEKAGDQGIREIVLGMAHRGRLNVLANIMGKSPQEIFREFADLDPKLHLGRGDVKYHLGYSSDWMTAARHKVHLSLCFNPSHLEFVNPVALGRMRAKQDRAGDAKREHTHGAADPRRRGVRRRRHRAGDAQPEPAGRLHAPAARCTWSSTTRSASSPPAEGRSSTYATDVAKMLQIPIFHVNGEDPEAVAQVVRLAMDFRHEFQRDVVIDMYCYRRRGHNEGDEPSFTQPVLYRAIDKRKTRPRQLPGAAAGAGRDHARGGRPHRRRADATAGRGAVGRQERRIRRQAASASPASGKATSAVATPTCPKSTPASTASALAELLEAQTRAAGRLSSASRRSSACWKRAARWPAASGRSIGPPARRWRLPAWPTAAIAIRLSGQDSTRGTFSQRHAVLHDYEDGHRYTPLAARCPRTRRRSKSINSPLSEAGVLGFEYGYSLDCPDGLVMWEAQFGDFVNAAQVIIDQFIASAEDKWRRLSGLVLLLPHGFEGRAPSIPRPGWSGS